MLCVNFLRVGMKNKKLVVFGIAEQAEVASFLFEHDSEYSVVAFTVDAEYIKEKNFNGMPVVAFEEVAKEYPPEDYDMFVAIGYTDTNKLRSSICDKAKSKGYTLASYVSSRAIIWSDLCIGENCLILELNNIQPFVKIGNNVTLWSGNHIGHHSIIEDNVFITSHVVISGGCHIKNNTFIGVNSTLRDHIVVEKENIIAMGTTITKSTEEYGVYRGTPAKASKLKSYDMKGI